MTKKVSKKNLLCLFPPKTGKLKSQEQNKLKQSAKRSTSVANAMDFSPAPDSTSDWQAHYDFLDMGAWGCGLFGAPMDREIEEIAWRAVQLAIESGDKDKIAKSYRHLFYLYSEFNHADTLAIGFKSVAAAVKAYGQSTIEVGEELAMIAVVQEFSNNHDLAIKTRDAAIRIFEKVSTIKRLFEALEMAICSAYDMGRGDKVEEYARCGIRLVKERCEKGSDEYIENLDYFEHMLETAHEPPVPIEVQSQQLLAMFPGLQKLIVKAPTH